MQTGTSRSPVLNISDVVAALVTYHSTGKCQMGCSGYHRKIVIQSAIEGLICRCGALVD